MPTVSPPQEREAITDSFTVHVFLNHDPFLASAFLPGLFPNFPDSAWQLPRRQTRHQPHALPRDGTPAWTNPRDGLGRYVLPQPQPGATTLGQVADSIERHFGIGTELHSHFTIFPQDSFSFYDRVFATWNHKALPTSMTLAEVRPLDEDATNMDPPLASRTIHLVLETKAAALRRIVGAAFLVAELGKAYEAYRSSQNRLQSFDQAFSSRLFDTPELQRALVLWRHASHTLSYLRRLQRRGAQNVTAQIERLEQSQADAVTTMSTLVRQWAEWVSLPEQPLCHLSITEPLGDDDVETVVLWVWETKYKLIDEWKALGRIHGLLWRLHIDAQPGNTHLTTSSLPSVVSQPAVLLSDIDVASNSPEDSPVQARSFRTADGSLCPQLSSFTISSGILLWGHILPMYYGSLSHTFTNNAAAAPAALPGGTIAQRVFTYRSAARTGEWRVRRYLSNWNDERGRDRPPTDHVGWVLCHTDVDPMEVVRTVRAITPRGEAFRTGNAHVNKDVLCVGRYDWSAAWQHPEDREFRGKFQAYAEPAIGPVDATRWWAKVNVNEGGYFAAVDAERLELDFLRAYKRDCEGDASAPVEKVFVNGDGERFGAYVRHPGTEYEFGWLFFSGEKHAQHDADELIGIVYDASYEGLGGLYHAVE